MYERYKQTRIFRRFTSRNRKTKFRPQLLDNGMQALILDTNQNKTN